LLFLVPTFYIFLYIYFYKNIYRVIENKIIVSGFVKLAIFSNWRYSQTGVILKLAIFSNWRYSQTGDILKLAIFSNWRYSQTGVILKLAIFSNWRYSQTGDILKQKLVENKFIFRSSIYFYTYIFRNIILTLSHSKLKN